MDNFALQQIINRILLLKFRYLGSFPLDNIPTLDNDTFAIINTQPSNMQGEQWIMIANFRHEFYFADSLSTVQTKKYSFLKQHYKQMMPASLTQVCAAFIQYTQLFISSSLGRKKLQGFTMLMYSLLKVITCNICL